MKQLTEKDNLAYLLHTELMKTMEKFMRKCPKADHNVILGAGNLYIAGFLINAPTKDAALKTLDNCVELMRNAINVTPDSFFGGGIRRYFNQKPN